MSVDQVAAERLECKPWCSPKHYRFCGGPCCPHLHRPSAARWQGQDGNDADRSVDALTEPGRAGRPERTRTGV